MIGKAGCNQLQNDLAQPRFSVSNRHIVNTPTYGRSMDFAAHFLAPVKLPGDRMDVDDAKPH